MIYLIEHPRIDYLYISMVGGGTLSTPKQKTESEKIREIVFDVFGMGFEDRKRDSGSRFQYFEKNGVNYVEKGTEHFLTVKGWFCLKERAFFVIKHFIHRIEKGGVPWKILRTDIRRNFEADRANDPFADLKKGFWIMRSSAESHYTPEILNRDFPDSSGALFRSNQFDVNIYDKSRQVQTFEKRIKRLKKDDKKRRLQVAMSRHKELYADKRIFRFELKLKNSEIANAFRSDLISKGTEQDFCYAVLEAFNASYPMKKDRSESKTYKRFFERGIYEAKKRRKSRSPKSNAEIREQGL